MNKKNILNITGIVLAMIIMIGVILGVSLSADVHYFGFYSILKVLTYGATMLFLFGVLTNQKVKVAGTSLMVLFFVAGIVPSIQRVKTFFIMFSGKINGQSIPAAILEKVQTPAGIIFVLQLLFAILLVLMLIFSIYALINDKKYNFKEISIMFLIIAVAFATIEIVENIYVFMDLLQSGFSAKMIIPRTPIMVFQYFIIVYLANGLKYSKEINLFYYITFFAYTVVIGLNTITAANLTGSNLIYTVFLISSSMLVYLYCVVVSILILKNK